MTDNKYLNELTEDKLRELLTEDLPKYGISVIDDASNQLVHFVAFWKEPTDEDYANLEEEIKTDPAFGLMDTKFYLRAAFLGEIEFHGKLYIDAIKRTIKEIQDEEATA